MKKIAHWDYLFQRHRDPCFLVDAESLEVLFLNDKMATMLGQEVNAIGMKFHQVIKNETLVDGKMVEIKPEFSLKTGETFEKDIYDSRLEMNFHATVTMVELDGQPVLLIACRTENSLLGNNSEFEEAVTRSIEILSQTSETVMISLCELLNNYYDCERAYIYRFNFENNTINCTALWCLDPAYRVYEELGTRMDGTQLLDWIQNDSDKNTVSADSEKPDFNHNSTIGQIMTTFQIKNLTISKIEDSNKKVVGVIGLSNREHFKQDFDDRLLTVVSRFIALDITKQSIETRAITVHHRDTLTGFFNRDGYTHVLKKVWRDKPKTLGVISANINGLKLINENMGITGGDKVIQATAKCLEEHFGYLFFRMSGDEFLGIAPNTDSISFNEQVTELHDKMKKESNYDFSFGHAFGNGNIDLTKLTLEAETIMYINKQEYYSSTKRSFDTVRDNILADLLTYLANDEFMVYLQPQVNLKDGSTYGAEALIRRFDKANQKMVFPDQFIPLYEQKSIIRHVDMFVVEAVCQLIEKWEKIDKRLPISVNLSRVTLQEYGIVDSIVEICDKYQVPHELLVIEVTERVGLVENNVASDLIRNFKEHGFHISLDDFGCAYSNIITLAQIQVDEVKIDKSLVDHLTTNKQNLILVKNVLAMCNELEDTSTLAEGIEDEQQAKLLCDLGCQLGQGYLYSRPIPVSEFEEKYIKTVGG